MIQHISYLSERVNCHQSQHPAAGARMGLGSRTKGPVHFSRLPHPPQQRPCLRRHHRDNPPTQGAKGDANRHSAQSEEMEDAELSSYQPLWLEGGGFYEGTFGGKRGPKKKKPRKGWTLRVGLTSTFSDLLAKTKPPSWISPPQKCQHLTVVIVDQKTSENQKTAL